MDSNNQISNTASTLDTVVLVVSFVAALTVVTLVSVCVRWLRRRDLREMVPHVGHENDMAGFDEKALERFPKLLYLEANKLKIGISISNSNNSTSGGFCCSVCLGDYKDSDFVRMLPDCGHVFHQNCVDSWLRLRATCPLCRRSLGYSNKNVVGHGDDGIGGQA